MYDFFDQAPVGLAIVGLDGQFIKVNARLAEELKRDGDRVLSFRFQDITHPEDLPENLENVERLVKGEIDRFQLDKRYLDGRGDVFWAQLNVTLVRNADGSPKHLVSAVQNIDARKRRETQLHSLAFRDVLTGLANRAGFEAQAISYLEDAQRTGRTCGLIVADMNGLKAINDKWGHAVGDLMIATLGRRLRRVLGRGGIAARLGGDEFAAMVAPIPPGLIPRLSSCLERPFRGDAMRIPMSVSLGLAVEGVDGATLFSLMRSADERMYRQKKRLHGVGPWSL